VFALSERKNVFGGYRPDARPIKPFVLIAPILCCDHGGNGAAVPGKVFRVAVPHRASTLITQCRFLPSMFRLPVWAADMRAVPGGDRGDHTRQPENVTMWIS